MVRANGEIHCSTSSFVLSTFASPNKTVLVLSRRTTARSSASSCTLHNGLFNIISMSTPLCTVCWLVLCASTVGSRDYNDITTIVIMTSSVPPSWHHHVFTWLFSLSENESFHCSERRRKCGYFIKSNCFVCFL